MASQRGANNKSLKKDSEEQAHSLLSPQSTPQSVSQDETNAQTVRIKQLEAEIEQLKGDFIKAAEKNEFTTKELQESNRELVGFTYIANHDLQEPLRKIHTFTKMVSKDADNTLSAESALYLDRIMVSVRRMQRLTDDLLNYAHLIDTDIEDFENTNLNSLLNDVLEELRDSIKTTNASVKVAELPKVKAVPVLMRQLFINLIGNALKYRRADGKQVIKISYTKARRGEIIALNASVEKQYYKIKIADNGIGFPQEQAQRIFEAFHRLHGKDKYEGTGIGLAICKKIALKHNGFITAESSPGNGASFKLFLPV
jgi:two-component system, chemotaxis family, CheB/CheR fusion protein